MQSNSQLDVMKMVGKDTRDYTIGFGTFVKTKFPVSDGSDVRLETGADIFLLK